MRTRNKLCNANVNKAAYGVRDSVTHNMRVNQNCWSLLKAIQLAARRDHITLRAINIRPQNQIIEVCKRVVIMFSNFEK